MMGVVGGRGVPVGPHEGQGTHTHDCNLIWRAPAQRGWGAAEDGAYLCPADTYTAARRHGGGTPTGQWTAATNNPSDRRADPPAPPHKGLFLRRR